MGDPLLKQAALDWAAAGFYVFPCIVAGKEPACLKGHNSATRDTAKIEAWWDENPNYNIGVSPHLSGHWVLDIDPQNKGDETLAELETIHGLLPETTRIRTPRGGVHHWFSGECRSTTGSVGLGIDTKGRGGYVLVPPSTVFGAFYEYDTNDADIVPGPEWVINKLNTKTETFTASDIDLDLPQNIERAISFLKNRAPGVQGHGGDAYALQTAYFVRDFGISRHVVLDLMMEHWNDRCDPPWDRDELDVKTINAAKYAQNEPGKLAIEPVETLFANFAATAPTVVEPRSPYYNYDTDEQLLLPRPTWMLPGLLQDNSVAVIFGPTGSFKSFIALDIALHIANGKAGYGRDACDPKPVVYFDAENFFETATAKVPAWKLVNQSAQRFPLYLVEKIPPAVEHEQINKAISCMKAHPALVVIDTLAFLGRGLEENSSRDMNLVLAAAEHIRDHFKCTVLLIHHTGKNAENGPRGSSAIAAGVTTMLEVQSFLPSNCVKMTVIKQKNAIARKKYFFKGEVAFNNSLTFRPIDKPTFINETSEVNLYSPALVGAALVELGATTPELAVSVHVLAAELGDDDLAVKHLVKEAKKSLRAYVTEEGLWFFPS